MKISIKVYQSVPSTAEITSDLYDKPIISSLEVSEIKPELEDIKASLVTPDPNLKI